MPYQHQRVTEVMTRYAVNKLIEEIKSLTPTVNFHKIYLQDEVSIQSCLQCGGMGLLYFSIPYNGSQPWLRCIPCKVYSLQFDVRWKRKTKELRFLKLYL